MDLASTCRFFGTPGRGINSHFYTVIPEECALVMQNPDWYFEAIAFYIAAPDVIQCPPSARPVFRLYNNGQGGQPNHRYTTSWPNQSHAEPRVVDRGRRDVHTALERSRARLA